MSWMDSLPTATQSYQSPRPTLMMLTPEVNADQMSTQTSKSPYVLKLIS